jgi:type IV pilus assembly protein PilC
MSLFLNTFFDKDWNFNNDKIVKILFEARKKQSKEKKKPKLVSNIEINLFNSVSKKEVWQFINKFSIFLNSWIDIKWALNILTKQISNPYLKRIVNEIKSNIDHWIAINETMLSYPKVFDNLTISLIKVWEKTWKLWHILNELDSGMLENLELKWKVKWAMIYPAILLVLTTAMVVFMMVFIVPKVTKSFQKAWVELPWPTQVIVNISSFLQNDYLIIVWIIIWTITISKLLNKTYVWKSLFSTIAVKLPVFWYIIRQSNVIYFIKSFTILLNSWVLLLESLKISSQVVSNISYKKELIRVKNEVELWLTISKSLWLNLEYESSIYMNKLFNEEFAYVVSTWEETWSLSNSLEKVWISYNWELKRYIWNLSSMMEPIIIVIVWFLVWSIIIAIMLPFFEMGKVAKNL